MNEVSWSKSSNIARVLAIFFARENNLEREKRREEGMVL